MRGRGGALRSRSAPAGESLLGLPTVREALLWERLPGGAARCGLCERRCLVRPGGRGFCRTRMNIGGALHTLVHGDLSHVSANPIEKKPFFHLWPGSLALTAGTWGCNLSCPWCQNHELSAATPDPRRASPTSPASFVEAAIRAGCQGTSLSFNEPTLLFEWALELFPLARERGLYNTYVSNGYMTEGALRALAAAGLDAIKLDAKGCREAVRRHCGADVGVVWRNLRLARSLGLHVEVVVLVVPGVNDGERCLGEVVRSHLDAAGPDVPLHFTRFHPDHRMADLPATPIAALERARELAAHEGVRFAYIGNVPGHPYEDTWCPGCGGLLVKRRGFEVVECRVTGDRRCPGCGEGIPLVGGLAGRGSG